MIEELLPHIGLSIEDKKVVELFQKWDKPYPKKVTCTPNNSSLRTKLELDGIIPTFGIGSYSRYLLPIPAKRTGSYIAQLIMLEITAGYKGLIPFDVSHNSTSEELTNKLGACKEVKFMGNTLIWKKNISDKHEIKVDDYRTLEGVTTRSITVQYIFEESK